MHESTMSLILHAGLLVKLVLIILLLCSVCSWAIIVSKHRALNTAAKQSATFLAAFEADKSIKELSELAKPLTLSPLANVFQAVHAHKAHGDREEIGRLLRRYEALEAAKLNAYLTFLATTGSTTPFIGLLGTVWGIMNAFQGIGAAGSASLAVVAPGIAEALITTAAGLGAAIPAVVAYNYYLSRARRAIIEMEDFSEELLGVFAKGAKT